LRVCEIAATEEIRKPSGFLGQQQEPARSSKKQQEPARTSKNQQEPAKSKSFKSFKSFKSHNFPKVSKRAKQKTEKLKNLKSSQKLKSNLDERVKTYLDKRQDHFEKLRSEKLSSQK
jgi:hypothetical protein